MIVFVILHYQAIDETIDCVNTIEKKVLGEKKIIIVDNCSPNGTGKELERMYKRSNAVKVISNTENLGFAKGNNIGYREAKKCNPDFIVIMNNDVFIQQNNFTELVKLSYDKYHYAIMGPDIYSTKAKVHQNPQRKTNYSFKELVKLRRKLEFKNNHKWLLKIKYMFPIKNEKEKEKELKFVNQIIENAVLHGACYIFSKEFVERHDSCFYSETFMYFESYILHYLAQKEGIRMIYDPSIKVLHHEDVATNQKYRDQYKKAIFVNSCLLESCEKFIGIIEDKRNLKDC